MAGHHLRIGAALHCRHKAAANGSLQDRNKQYAISQPLFAGDAITKVIIKRSRAALYTAQAKAGDIRCNRFVHRKWACEDHSTSTACGRVKITLLALSNLL